MLSTTLNLWVMIGEIVGEESVELVEALMKDMLEAMQGFKTVKDHNDQVYEALIKEQEEVNNIQTNSLLN